MSVFSKWLKEIDSINCTLTARSPDGSRTAAWSPTGVRAGAVPSPPDVRPVAARCSSEAKSACTVFFVETALRCPFNL